MGHGLAGLRRSNHTNAFRHFANPHDVRRPITRAAAVGMGVVKFLGVICEIKNYDVIERISENPLIYNFLLCVKYNILPFFPFLRTLWKKWLSHQLFSFPFSSSVSQLFKKQIPHHPKELAVSIGLNSQ
jgi:hypothetical protein